MSRILLGTICGLVYGALSAASMIPLSFSDKRAALLGAFLNRFAIGFVIGAARLPVPSWAQGLIFGVLLSLPDAIITKAFAPILILGAVGGTIIGLIVGKWVVRNLCSCALLLGRYNLVVNRCPNFFHNSFTHFLKSFLTCFNTQSRVRVCNHTVRNHTWFNPTF